jgi:hypothetical protein
MKKDIGWEFLELIEKQKIIIEKLTKENIRLQKLVEEIEE